MNQVLLIIDTQKDLVEGSHVEQGVFQKDLLLSKINLLIQKARKLAVPVIFIRDKDVAEGEGEGFDVHPEIDRVSGDACFDKEATNAFYRTGLLDYLKQHQVEHLVIAGCKTEHCIDTAVRTATVNGFDVTLAGDAHSTSNSDVLSANQIIAHHNAVLHGHYNVDHFSIVRKVEEDLFTPSHDTYR